MSLSRKQRDFAALTVKLFQKILDSGYEYTYGDAFRDHRVHGKPGEKKSYSHPNSTHKFRLAIDVNLFKDDVYLTQTADHRPFGLYWESLDPRCRWGGRWGGDGNHYSFEHNGVS